MDLGKLKESIKKFLGVTTDKDQAAGQASPLLLAAPSKEELLKLVEQVRADLEKETGKKIVLHVAEFKPGKCQCLACKLRAAAQWN